MSNQLKKDEFFIKKFFSQRLYREMFVLLNSIFRLSDADWYVLFIDMSAIKNQRTFKYTHKYIFIEIISKYNI
jgi:hypothetical protein